MTVAENAAAIEALVARVAKLEVLNNPTQYLSQLQAELESYRSQIHELTARVQELESGKGQNG